MAHLTNLPNVTLRLGTSVVGLLTRTTEARLTLSCSARLAASLVIGADGHDSPVREAAGIGHRTTRYGQKTLAFTVTQDVAHEDISTEIYHVGGPFTMVPLPAHNGNHSSAIVWMNEGARTLELAGLDDRSFNAELYARSAGLFGRLEVSSPKGIFPIITQRADSLISERVALIAEAAHVLPPIGAQGLNTSVNDVAALLDAVTGAADAGSDEVLAQYQAHVPVTSRCAVLRLICSTAWRHPACRRCKLSGWPD